jgi:hypothetical protein
MTGEDHELHFHPPAGILAVLFVLPLAADLVAKFAARHLLSAGEPVPVFPGFVLTLGFNRRVSFQLFPANEPLGVAFMIAIQLAFTFVLIVWTLWQREYWLTISVALIATRLEISFNNATHGTSEEVAGNRLRPA